MLEKPRKRTGRWPRTHSSSRRTSPTKRQKRTMTFVSYGFFSWIATTLRKRSGSHRAIETILDARLNQNRLRIATNGRLVESTRQRPLVSSVRWRAVRRHRESRTANGGAAPREHALGGG